jgi:serine/threonine protein kinase
MGAAQTTPVNVAKIDEAGLQAFSKLFRVEPAKLRHLVQNLAAGAPTSYWIDIVDNLDTFEMDHRSPIHTGGSGKIYCIDNNIVKRIPIIHDYNIQCVFLECWIQTLLGSDPEYGSHIPKIFRIRRSKSLTSLVLYIEMERIPDTFHDIMCKEQITLPKILPYFKQLAAMLKHFDAKYQFRHRDLHTSNLMLKGDKLYLIDFGRSSLGETFVRQGEYQMLPAGKQFTFYSTIMKWDGAVSASHPFDIIVFLTCFKESYVKHMDDEVNAAVTKLIGADLYAYMEAFAKRDFHFKDKRLVDTRSKDPEYIYMQAYACKIKEWDLKHRILLNNNPHITTQGFCSALDDIPKMMLAESDINLNAAAYAEPTAA